MSNLLFLIFLSTIVTAVYCDKLRLGGNFKLFTGTRQGIGGEKGGEGGETKIRTLTGREDFSTKHDKL